MEAKNDEEAERGVDHIAAVKVGQAAVQIVELMRAALVVMHVIALTAEVHPSVIAGRTPAAQVAVDSDDEIAVAVMIVVATVAVAAVVAVMQLVVEITQRKRNDARIKHWHPILVLLQHHLRLTRKHHLR